MNKIGRQGRGRHVLSKPAVGAYDTGRTMLDFTDKEHRRQCRVAGCKHPAVYTLTDGETVQGWCDPCRRVAFAGPAKEPS